MSLQIEKLSFSYPSSHTVLFEDFSLQLHEGWTCIAGSNGCGKSTLLKLIAGLLSPDGGTIFAGGTTAAGDTIYCPQETSEMPENLYSAFWSDDNETRRFFSMLHVNEEMLSRYDSLSGGEKKRIQLACALADRPSVLLLDEPTNHLDSATVKMISDALALFDGTGIMVSHDRSFSDALCKRTVYLFNEARAVSGGRDCIAYDSYPCGLTKALKLRQSNAERSRGEWDKFNAKAADERQKSQKLAEENERSKSRLSKKTFDAKDHDTKAKMDVARVSGKDRTTGDAKARLDTQIQRTEAARDAVKKSLKRKEGFSVAGTGFAKPIVIEETVITASAQSDSGGASSEPTASGVPENSDSKATFLGKDGFSGSELSSDYKLHIPRIQIDRGAKIALTGQNGTGKTLFIKHLIGELEKADRTKELMYLPQEISEKQRKKIFAQFNELDDAHKGEVLSTLYRLGSEPESLTQTEAADETTISPGELRKLMISLAILKPLSLLILDEPTNHMDITSVLALENALSSLSCAMLVVSHDEHFLEKVTEKRLHAERNGNSGRIVYL